MPEIGTSTSLFETFDAAELDACREAGIVLLELDLTAARPDPFKREDVRVWDEYRRLIHSRDLKLWSVHLPFGRLWDIASPDPRLRDETLGKQGRWLEICAAWGASVAVIHPSAEPIPDAARGEFFSRSKEALAHLNDVAREVGIGLAVECLPRTCLGNTSDEILRLIDGIEDIGVCFDTNHLLQEPPEKFAAVVGQKIVTTHISDYDGVDEKHWMPGTGVVNWQAVIDALRRIGYSGPFVFEVSHQDPSRPYSPKDLAACWDSIGRLRE